MSGYVITCEKRNEILFMVDRRRQKKSFWSNRLVDVFVYQDYQAALRKANSLKFNNPKVISLEKAREIEQEQLHDKMIEQAEAESDESLLIAGTKS